MIPPITTFKKILGIDPGYSNGCKCSIINNNGKVLTTFKFFINSNPEKILIDKIKEYNIELICLGNGTASNDVKNIINKIINDKINNLKYIIVNEAGTSVYSVTKDAKDEFPDIDSLYISSIMIARIPLNPISEYVKIPPQSIGVGQYQHDISNKSLTDALNGIVIDCVNEIPIDINIASIHLLKKISGLNKNTAEKLYNTIHNDKIIKCRKDLLKVKGLGKVAYTQCAGFITIVNSNELLDHTRIHPDDYILTYKLISKIGIDKYDLKESWSKLINKLNIDIKEYSKLLNCDYNTLEFIINELKRPNYDPRINYPSFTIYPLKNEIQNTYEIGSLVTGTIRNITDFGYFIDIGLKRDAFLYRPTINSMIGDIIKSRIVYIDDNNINLSIKDDYKKDIEYYKERYKNKTNQTNIKPQKRKLQHQSENKKRIKK